MPNEQNRDIVFFIGTLCAGGAERVVSLLSNKLAEEEFSVEILTYYDREVHYKLTESIKITCIERETKSRNIFKNFLFLRRHIKMNAAMVISFLAVFNMMTIVARIGLKVPIYVADRNDPRFVPEHILLRKFRNLLYHFATGVIIQSKQNKAYFSRYIQKKSYVIPNPIDIGENIGLALRTKKKNRIVSVGRLIKVKNHKLLINAYSLIFQRFPNYELTIYGEGSYRRTLEKHIQELGLVNKIKLPGTVKDIFTEIADAELFVLSSNYEGMPNALIEAMCLGLPVISTKVSGATDLICDGVNGILVDVNDEKALARAMEDILTNKGKKDSFARKAVLVNKQLEIDKIFDEWKKLVIVNSLLR